MVGKPLFDFALGVGVALRVDRTVGVAVLRGVRLVGVGVERALADELLSAVEIVRLAFWLPPG